MTEQLFDTSNTYSDAQLFKEHVQEMVGGAETTKALLGQWPGGILEFAGVAFPGFSADEIYAKKHDREPEGHGPHFDVYTPYVNKDLSWIGHYNLSGVVELTIANLPEDLAKSYDARYPLPTNEAAEARRHYSRIALGDPAVKKQETLVIPGTKLLIPVNPDVPYLIHEFVPRDPTDSGSYVKMILPSEQKTAHKILCEAEYEPLDVFVTKALGGTFGLEDKSMTAHNIRPKRLAVQELPRVQVQTRRERPVRPRKLD